MKDNAWIDLQRLSGQRLRQIPDALYEGGYGEAPTVVQSLVAATGVDPRSGGLFDPRSQAAALSTVSGKIVDKFYWVNSLSRTAEFANVITYRNGKFIAVYEDLLHFAWGEYAIRVQKDMQDRALKNQPLATVAAFYGRVRGK